MRLGPRSEAHSFFSCHAHAETKDSPVGRAFCLRRRATERCMGSDCLPRLGLHASDKERGAARGPTRMAHAKHGPSPERHWSGRVQCHA